MIPRLWCCTHHSLLELLAFPFSPILLLGLFILGGSVRAIVDTALAGQRIARGSHRPIRDTYPQGFHRAVLVEKLPLGDPAVADRVPLSLTSTDRLSGGNSLLVREDVFDANDLLPIVLNSNGRAPSRQAVLSALKEVQKRHSLPPRSFHSLRHYFLSAMVRGGANLEAVRELAGHSKLLTTQRYLHASGADLRDAVSRLPGNAKPLGN